MRIASLSTGGVFSAPARAAVAFISGMLVAASPMPSAAQDSGYETYRYYLTATARQSLDDLCVGDRVLIDVTADRILSNRRASDTDRVTNPPVQVFGVALKATAGSPDVGSLFPSSQRTAARSTPPGSARFSFAPIQPGFTTLLFEGTESRSWFAGGDIQYLSTELTATVKSCEYDVTVVSRWSVVNSDFTAVTDVVRLRPTGQAGHYAGSATVHWLMVDAVGPGCSQHPIGPESEVEVIAELEGTDHLIVDVDFGPVTGAYFTYLCPDDTINSTYLFTNTPAPLTFTASASGDDRHLPQTLVDNNFEIFNRSGSAEVSVQPVPE